MELTTTQGIIGSLIVAVFLAGLHLAAPKIRKLPFVPETLPCWQPSPHSSDVL